MTARFPAIRAALDRLDAKLKANPCSIIAEEVLADARLELAAAGELAEAARQAATAMSCSYGSDKRSLCDRYPEVGKAWSAVVAALAGLGGGK